jgi:pimeloyl-ACP methyl ester carboxylesterase
MTVITSFNAPTQHIDVSGVRYAFRRFGNRGGGLPLLCLQHFTGTLDNWDPAVVNALAEDREIILFDSAGVGRSDGAVPLTIGEMATDVLRFIDAQKDRKVHVLGFSMGGFVAQEITIGRPELVERLILSGTAPEGGEGAAMDRPELVAIYTSVQMTRREKLKRLFFPPTPDGQAAASAFVDGIDARGAEHTGACSPDIARAQLQAMKAWASFNGDIRKKLARITHPVLVTSGANDIVIPVRNSFVLAEYLQNATLIIYPNSGHGALFQYSSTYVAHVREFLRGH